MALAVPPQFGVHEAKEPPAEDKADEKPAAADDDSNASALLLEGLAAAAVLVPCKTRSSEELEKAVDISFKTHSAQKAGTRSRAVRSRFDVLSDCVRNPRVSCIPCDPVNPLEPPEP